VSVFVSETLSVWALSVSVAGVSVLASETPTAVALSVSAAGVAVRALAIDAATAASVSLAGVAVTKMVFVNVTATAASVSAAGTSVLTSENVTAVAASVSAAGVTETTIGFVTTAAVAVSVSAAGVAVTKIVFVMLSATAVLVPSAGTTVTALAAEYRDRRVDLVRRGQVDEDRDAGGAGDVEALLGRVDQRPRTRQEHRHQLLPSSRAEVDELRRERPGDRQRLGDPDRLVDRMVIGGGGAAERDLQPELAVAATPPEMNIPCPRSTSSRRPDRRWPADQDHAQIPRAGQRGRGDGLGDRRAERGARRVGGADRRADRQRARRAVVMSPPASRMYFLPGRES
jgi:hypothetical protein